MNKVSFWYADKYRSILQVVTTSLSVQSQACPKYPKEEICITLEYFPKNMEDEVHFLPADKHESFLQIDSITLNSCSQKFPKYPKQQV